MLGDMIHDEPGTLYLSSTLGGAFEGKSYRADGFDTCTITSNFSDFLHQTLEPKISVAES